MKTLNETTQQPTRAGRYGKDFGGQYIPETLMTELEKVTKAFNDLKMILLLKQN